MKTAFILMAQYDGRAIVPVDLDGISRLFEMGATIPRAAGVSGRRSWKSLQRYSHMRRTGGKYAGWPWLPVVTETGS